MADGVEVVAAADSEGEGVYGQVQSLEEIVLDDIETSYKTKTPSHVSACLGIFTVAVYQFVEVYTQQDSLEKLYLACFLLDINSIQFYLRAVNVTMIFFVSIVSVALLVFSIYTACSSISALAKVIITSRLDGFMTYLEYTAVFATIIVLSVNPNEITIDVLVISIVELLAVVLFKAGELNFKSAAAFGLNREIRENNVKVDSMKDRYILAEIMGDMLSYGVELSFGFRIRMS